VTTERQVLADLRRMRLTLEFPDSCLS